MNVSSVPRHWRHSAWVGSSVVVAAWLICLAIAASTTVPEPIAHVALAGHVMALTLSFGVITLLDWQGFMWVIGRRTRRDATQLADIAQPLVWTGIGALLLTGALLHPDLSAARTWAKLVAILVLMLNGVQTSRLAQHLHALPPRVDYLAIPSWIRRRVAGMAMVSQATWWTAIIVGFVTNASRH